MKLVLPSRRLTRLGILLGVVAAVAVSAVVRLAWSGKRNLVFNGSFSGSLDGWLSWQANLTRIKHGEQKAGAVRVVSTGRTAGSSLYTVYTFPRPVVDLVPGATFTADASVRTDQAERRLCLVLREWGAADQKPAVAQSCVIGSTRWRRFTPLSYTTRKRGSSLELLVAGSTSSRGDWFDVDDVTLESGR